MRGENSIVSWTVRGGEQRHNNKGPLNPTYSHGRPLNTVRDRYLLTLYWLYSVRGLSKNVGGETMRNY